MPQDFYFFDFDQNIMTVTVPMVFTNMDGTEVDLSSDEFSDVKKELQDKGTWSDKMASNQFKYYRDLPDVPTDKQPFLDQIKTAIKSTPKEWQSPAWKLFVYVCNSQKPFSLITARGHSDATTKAGFELLKETGWIKKTPNYFSIYNVTFPSTNKELSGGNKKLGKETDTLKGIAIQESVDKAIAEYGEGAHHFGMSDDTTKNIDAVAHAMSVCKDKFPNMKFFVLSTNNLRDYRAEILRLDVPVEDEMETKGYGPLGI